jgi:hypothetical protein
MSRTSSSAIGYDAVLVYNGMQKQMYLIQQGSYQV